MRSAARAVGSSCDYRHMFTDGPRARLILREVIPPMAEISAAAVMSLRGKTGLPMMDCKKALAESGGDEAAAVEWLRKQGIKTKESRIDRATEAGRIAVFADINQGVGAMVEVRCESAPVAGSPEFRQF